jgi:hypothetical protein
VAIIGLNLGWFIMLMPIRREIMKKEFKKWLISLNCEGINSLGIDEIVSRVDEELRIVRANEQERIVLGELIAEFKC